MGTTNFTSTKTPFGKEAATATITSAKTVYTSTTAVARPQAFKRSAAYVMDLLGEGLKQNFLGPNIDMEFLILTVRSLANTSAKAVQQFIQKHSVAGQRTAKRFQINQHTLSHS